MKHNKVYWGIALALILTLVMGTVALADNVNNDITAGGNDTFTAGGSTTVYYWIVANNGDGETGCNATLASPAVVTINSPSSLTATPSSLTFTSCGTANKQAVTYSSTTAGDYATSVSVSDSGAGTYNTNPSNKTLHVLAAADSTPPSISYDIVGTLGSNGWYTSDVTVTWTVTDPESTVSSTTGCGLTTLTTETTGVTLTCSATSAGGTASESVTIKLDKTGPSASLAVTAGTLGSNGWYTSNVTVSTTGSDTISSPVSCTVDQFQTDETSGTVFNGSCTNDAGLTTNAASLTVKRDKTGPTAALAVTAGTLGTNGWYTSDVTVSTTGSDDVASPVTCTVDQYQTEETTGTTFNGSCTNNAGLTTNADPLTVKLDKTGPTATLAVTAGTLGNNGWYVSDVTVSTTGSDDVASPVACTADQFLTSDTTGTVFNGSCTNDAGLTTDADPLTVKRDATTPTINIVKPANTSYILNASIPAEFSCSDETSLIASCTGTSANGSNFDTGTVGPKSFTVDAEDNAGNTFSATNHYSVVYATGGMCMGAPGHTILQPINSDGTSVFKQKSTIPAKFRVCDANGVSIGTPGVVASFKLVKIVAGLETTTLDSNPDSTTPDTAFRWSATDQQWIFNINTKNLTANKTYFYVITLNDGSTIEFNFGLR